MFQASSITRSEINNKKSAGYTIILSITTQRMNNEEVIMRKICLIMLSLMLFSAVFAVDSYIKESINEVSENSISTENENLTLPVSSRTGDLVINEINYNSSDDFDCDDWVELYNPADSSLDVSGWEFRDEDDSHQFFMPANTIVPADGYIVLVNDTSLFCACFPNVTNYIGDIGFGFSGGGEALRLYDANGTLIDSVAYDDEAPWPTEPDGDGPTLELVNPLSDNTDASNWQASNGHGTPGSVNNLVGIDEDTIIQPVATLQAYPNPFNPTTNIAFSIPETSEVELNVYNIRGQKVKTLANEEMTAGSHTIVWNGNSDNGKSVASGVYFTILKADKSTITKKLILLK